MKEIYTKGDMEETIDDRGYDADSDTTSHIRYNEIHKTMNL